MQLATFHEYKYTELFMKTGMNRDAYNVTIIRFAQLSIAIYSITLLKKKKKRTLTLANSKIKEDSLNMQTPGKEPQISLEYFYSPLLWKQTLNNLPKETLVDKASFLLASFPQAIGNTGEGRQTKLTSEM